MKCPSSGGRPLSPPNLESWRLLHFGPGTGNSGEGANTSDFDRDGLVNLLEYAFGLDPREASPASLSIAAGEAGALDLRYTRSVAALSAGAVFTAEWSDDPAGPWSVQGVTESILSEDFLLQRVKAAVPAGTNGRRFVRLRVTAP